MRSGHWVALAASPLAVFAILLARPNVDGHWENHPAHFWIVLGAAAVATALGWGVTTAARRRRDARLLLISLAFIVSASFFGLHALATPGVLLGKNAGFELATPVGLLLAGVFAASAAVELEGARAERVLRAAPFLVGAVVAIVAAWAVFSLGELPPLDNPLASEELNGWQIVLASLGVALFGVAAFGFLRIHRRRHERFVLAFAIACALLAEAMVVIAWARNWQVSWWEWHVLMLGAFVLIALVARAEWHQERFSALYLDETRAGATDVSILFADLAGFTSYTERHEPDEVAAMLNAYFGRIIPLMRRAGGDVHQIVGDEIMVVFGTDGTPDHAARAARAGLDAAARGLADRARARRLAALPGRREHRRGARGRRRRRDGPPHVRLRRRFRQRGCPDPVRGPGRRRARGRGDVPPPRRPRGRRGRSPLRVKGKSDLLVAYLLHRLDRGEQGTALHSDE